jgi:hypothetical protein
MSETISKRVIAGRGAEIAVGAAYLLAAGLKAWNFNLFIGQILAYQIFTSTGALTAVAITTLALETFLGVSMIVGSPWRKGVLAAGFGMLLFFTAVIVYAWQVHNLKDCGCFGKVSMTPPQAIAKNLLFMVLTGLAWLGLVSRGEATSVLRYPRARLVVPGLLALFLCFSVVPQLGGTVTTENGGAEIAGRNLPPEAARPSGKEAGPFAGYRIVPEFGEPMDLSQGEYLVALLSMTCEHCMAAVPEINAYIYEGGLPPVGALCLEPEEGSLENFQALAGPEFPMYSVGNNMLAWAKLCSGPPPQLCYVRNGVAVKVWKDVMPTLDELHEGIAEADAAHSAESAQ